MTTHLTKSRGQQGLHTHTSAYFAPGLLSTERGSAAPGAAARVELLVEFLAVAVALAAAGCAWMLLLAGAADAAATAAAVAATGLLSAAAGFAAGLLL